jgi:BirA family biotin operon repressor/biotin-[acetyl-CoA-carboxylase] ligase
MRKKKPRFFEKRGFYMLMNERALHRTLADLPLGGVRFFDRIGSTNDAARTWASAGASAGAPDLALLLAEEQTAGRGRLGRRWFTPPGAALAFSLVLRPQPVERNVIPLYSALGALAVVSALEGEYGLRPEIKWPNDVLLHGRKLCGVLAEAAWLGERAESVILGVGLNVSAASVPASPDFPATCLEAASGRAIDRLALLHDILAALLAWRPRLASQEFIPAWEARLAYRGAQVHAWAEGMPIRAGRVEGLERDGSLRLRSAKGESFSISFGEVHLRPVV